MKKTILSVFGIIAILFIALVGWNITFRDGGIVESMWNGVVTPVNGAWQTVVGADDAVLIPELDLADVDEADDIDIDIDVD